MFNMTTAKVTNDRLVVAPLTRWGYAEDLDRMEILKVLDRAAREDGFIAQLTFRGSDALEGYRLTNEAKTALLSGDIRWIQARVGKLDARLSTWLQCRLEQEIW